MASEVQMIGYELIKTGSLVSFRIVEEEVLATPDEAEFGMRLLLTFVAEDGEDDLAETPNSEIAATPEGDIAEAINSEIAQAPISGPAISPAADKPALWGAF